MLSADLSISVQILPCSAMLKARLWPVVSCSLQDKFMPVVPCSPKYKETFLNDENVFLAKYKDLNLLEATLYQGERARLIPSVFSIYDVSALQIQEKQSM